MQRYFAKAKNNEELLLYDSDCYHIKNVMRNNVGDKIEVVYDNVVYVCCIQKLVPLELAICDILNDDSELKINLTVAVALVNEQKFDLILQKLTELGVNNIIPVKTERSIVKLDNNKIDKKMVRWQTICKEASEQSKRILVPKVLPVMSINDLALINYQLKLVCSLSDNTKELTNYLTDQVSEILFVIGPEGGLSPSEEEKLLVNNFKPVSLSKRVFRVETAAIYVASIINYIYRG